MGFKSLIISGILILSVSCSKSLDDVGKLNSVDVASTTRLNLAKKQCQGSYTANAKLLTVNDGLFLEGASESSKAELSKALTNLPELFQEVFYNLGGRIYISNKSRDICARVSSDSHVTPLTCSYIGKGGQYFLVMNSDPVHIADSTIEGFGYVLSQFLRNLSVKNGQLVKSSQSPFNQALKGLSANFINEIREKPRHSLAAYDSRLPKLVGDKKNLKSCDIGDSAIQRSFDSAAFALHFRASYCSIETAVLDKAFLTKSKTYFDSYMYPFLSAMTEGRQLQYVSPPSCGSVTYSFAGNLFVVYSEHFQALGSSRTLCVVCSAVETMVTQVV